MGVSSLRRSSAVARALALLAGFVATSVVLGIVASGLVIPAAGATGGAARAGVDFFDALPGELAVTPPAQRSMMYASDGKTVIASFYDENRIVEPLTDIAPVMRQAIVAIEDSRFYSHGGVDAHGVLRATVNDVTGGDTQGASTLTQQYVKNVLVEQAAARGDSAGVRAAQEKSIGRKLREMKLAISLEKRLTKDQILERYLNIVFFGDSLYGVETASRYFFGTDAKSLTLSQAALLAGLVQSPTYYNPLVHPDAARKRRDTVLARMYQLNVIDRAAYTAAVAGPLGLQPQRPRNGCANAAENSWAYFCDYVVHSLQVDPAYAWMGSTAQERLTTLLRGGFSIVTTLDPRLEQAAFASVTRSIPVTDRSGVAAAAVTVQPGTGNVVAMAQNRVYDPAGGRGRTTINYAVDQAHGGSQYGFQPGSTFKAFTVAAWLEAGKRLDDVVDAPNSLSPTPADYRNTCVRVRTAGWHPGNDFDTIGGGQQVSVIDATKRSINTAFINMSQQLDLCEIADIADRMGVKSASPQRDVRTGKVTTKIQPYPSMVIGAQNVTPLAMSAAYAGFAAEGSYCAPRSVLAITGTSGAARAVAPVTCTQAVSKEVADGVAYDLSHVFEPGGTGNIFGGIGRPAAGKTGTTDNAVDTWFVGFTPQFSTAVWVANPDTVRGRRRPMHDITINGVYHPTVFGGLVAGPTWKAIMEAAHQDLPVRDFPAPPPSMIGYYSGSGVGGSGFGANGFGANGFGANGFGANGFGTNGGG